MKNTKEKLIIIDGNALIHRSFHAIPPTLRDKNGRLTNAVYGFTSFLLKAVEELKPSYVILTLDRKSPTFRHEAYAEYKATRTKAPDELYEQIPLVKEVATVLNIPIFELDGFEADDLIGTLCYKLKKSDLQKIIITGDMDTLQLVRDDVNVYTMSRGMSDSILYDAEKVKERYGFGPDKIIEFKALRGDPSDNIPGVKGIGEKTATDLILNFSDLEGIYQAIEKKDSRIKERISGLLNEHKDNAFMSRELATINCEAPIEADLKKALYPNFKKDEALKIFGEFGFRSLVAKLSGGEKSNEEKALKENNKKKAEQGATHYSFIKSEKEKEYLLKEIEKEKFLAFDIVCEESLSNKKNIIGLGLALSGEKSFFLPFSENISEIKDIFSSPEIKKAGHDLKSAIRFLDENGIAINGIVFDSMVASYVLDPSRRQHDLNTIIFNEFGEEFGESENKKAGQLSLMPEKINIEELGKKSAKRADYVFRLQKILSTNLKEKELSEVFEDIEMPLVEVLADMEKNGIKIDLNPINDLSVKSAKTIKDLEKKIYKLAGKEFNINSTKQLKEILFEDLKISTKNIKKTKTGFSTAEDELDKMEDLHPIIPELKSYRETNKLLTTYLAPLPSLINKNDGRIHSSFNQTITSTGRLSSTDPNLQNIPARTEEGNIIRSAFIADKGFKLIGLDYSQIELRLAAHLSGDKKMIEAFNKGLDIHSATAAEINGVTLDEVTKDMRRAAKATNFGIIYGQGPHGLAMAAGISYAEATNFIKKYFLSYPDVKKMMDDLIEETRENGFSKTMFGRKRPLPEINSSIPPIRKAAERMAINAPLQGSAADIIKLAMINIYREIKNHPEEIRLLLQVHDELIFEVKEDKVEKYLPHLKKVMSEAAKLKVPLSVEGDSGNNWSELK